MRPLNIDTRFRVKRYAKLLLRKGFEAGQAAGVDVLPRHFYSDIPDIRDLKSRTDWRVPRSMIAVAGAGLDEQIAEFQDTCQPDLVGKAEGVGDRASRANGAIGYGPVEAVVLSCFIARRQPRHVVQIGAGVSTAVILEASSQTRVTCIDPYPTDYLVGLEREERIRLLNIPAQDVPMETFTQLEAGDLLFVDSTHTVKAGSEVNRIILEVLPRLNPGVWVHFHDILWPYDYQFDLLDETLFFWNESVLLHALLINNPRLRIAFALSWLHNEAPEAIGRAIPSYMPAPTAAGVRQTRRGHFPTAAYLRVVG